MRAIEPRNLTGKELGKRIIEKHKTLFVLLAILIWCSVTVQAESLEIDLITESNESLKPYLDLIGKETNNGNIDVDNAFLDNISNVKLMGYSGTVSHRMTAVSSTQIRVMKWISNDVVTENEFDNFINSLNAFFGSSYDFKSYNNISDESYQWDDYDRLCYVIAFYNEEQKMEVTWYLDEEYIKDKNLEKGETEETDVKEKTAEKESDGNVYSADEQEFLDIFEDCYNQYSEEGLGTQLYYAELEDIYQKHPDNEMMKNLYYFCTACDYYWLANVLNDDSEIEAGKKEAAKIDPNYTGAYSEEVVSFAKGLLGDSYAMLAEDANTEQQNYENLSMQDKIDIQNYIMTHENIDEDVLWEEIAEKYGISTEHVSQINIDIDVIKAAGEQRRKESEAANKSIQYDATLSYGAESVVIANSKDDLDDYISYLAKEDKNSISSMILNGQIAYVDNGTKVNILERKLSVAKVKILEGVYKDVEGWTIIEAAQSVTK